MRRLACLMIGLLMLAGLACEPVPTATPTEAPAAVKEERLLAGYEACVSAGGKAGYCQCLVDRLSLGVPADWFLGTAEPKPEWIAQAEAACAPTPTPVPTPVPFSVEDWDPYTPIPDGISGDDWEAAYEKWSVEYEAMTTPLRKASDLVLWAWANGEVNALLSYCQYWNELQGGMWTPQMRQLAEVGNLPSRPKRMDCRNMVLDIYLPGASVHDYIADAP